MFGRQKTPPPTEPAAEPVPAQTHGAQGKGRPTPKRRDQEAARRHPLVPADRDAAKKAARDQARLDRVKSREAFARGDEAALPARDRGPIKRFIRDTVDSRWNMGEILLPLMVIMIVFTMIPNRTVQTFSLFFVWLVILAGIVDCALLWRRIKKRVRVKFDQDPPKGSAFYTWMRAFQLRMSRMPRPQVKRGTKIS